MPSRPRPRRAATQKMPPDGRLRQSQMVTTFGPGAMYDLLDHAVLIGGLDFWRLPNDGKPVHEPRLRDKVADVLRELKHPSLSVDAPFRKPPDGDEQNPNEANGVQVYEFPRWFVCQNPRCRALTRVDHLESKGKDRIHACGGAEQKRERCVPVRFVVTCTRGHLSDVDWPFWVHHEGKCEAPRLRLDEGATGDFSEVAVTCLTCGQRRRLIDLTVKDKTPPCSGERPWLGREGWEKCGERQRLLTRTASNGYFAQVMSALSIPEPDSLRRRLQGVWKFIEVAEDAAGVATIRKMFPNVKAACRDATDAEVFEAIVAQRENRKEDQLDLREAEFKQLVEQPLEKPGELPPAEAALQFWARRVPVSLPGVERLVLARRLREVQVQIGFTRLEPKATDTEGDILDLGVELAPLSLQRDWLPAVEINGEGLFLRLEEAALATWEQRPAVGKRGEQLLAGFEAWKTRVESKLPFPGLRYYLLHSLSHALLTAMSLECGYPASSIRERVYCGKYGAGVLLSTGTAGAEGTLGGLVEEGRRLEIHFSRAHRDALLCSNDPVCAQHDPKGPTDRQLEGAACHGCLFLPECSCEKFNQFLDRALVFPTLGLEDVAFFAKP